MHMRTCIHVCAYSCACIVRMNVLTCVYQCMAGCVYTHVHTPSLHLRVGLACGQASAGDTRAEFCGRPGWLSPSHPANAALPAPSFFLSEVPNHTSRTAQDLVLGRKKPLSVHTFDTKFSIAGRHACFPLMQG